VSGSSIPIVGCTGGAFDVIALDRESGILRLTGIFLLSGRGTTASVPCNVAANPDVDPLRIPPFAAAGISSPGRFPLGFGASGRFPFSS
jgi:hypothetical protein